MFFQENINGVLLRVRLSPNAAQCRIGGVWANVDGEEYLKISVISVPEKGKANQELIRFLSKILGVAKSDLKIVSGELDRQKKILISGETALLCKKLQNLREE